MAGRPLAVAGNPTGDPELAAPGVIVNLGPGTPPRPRRQGPPTLADMDTGQVLVANAPRTPHPPASTLRTLTALTLIPLLDPNTKILVKPQDVDGTRFGILAGMSCSVGTLLRGMLIT